MLRGHLSEIFASFQGEGLLVGQKHLFVRMSGCNLRCAYCDTPGSLEREKSFTIYPPGAAAIERSNPVSTADLTTLVGPFLESGGPLDAISLTGGEPLLQATFLRAWLEAAKLPIPVMLETSGVLHDALAEVIDLVDIISMDIKLPSNTAEPPFWNEHAEFARRASDRRLYAKILVDDSTASIEFERAVALLGDVAVSVPLFIQPIFAADGSIQTSEATLTRFHASARRVLDDVRIVPQTHKMLGLR